MSENDTQHDDPQKWIREPTDSIHGIQLVDHDGTAFVEQINGDGDEVQSIMITETQGFIEAAEWFAARHTEE